MHEHDWSIDPYGHAVCATCGHLACEGDDDCEHEAEMGDHPEAPALCEDHARRRG